MNREDIIKMAREAGLSGLMEGGLIDYFERFAALVAAAEREACVANVLAYGGIHIYDASKILETSRARAKE
jgi:hypothetical protein